MWGEPGIGKSAKLTANAAARHKRLETVIGSVRESTDFPGLPIEVNGTVQYSPLAWAQRLADAPSGLLHLGELFTSAPSVQKAMLRIVQERWVGDLQLPESVAIIADANPTSSAVDGWDLAAPVANRFIHLDWRFNAEEWLLGASIGFAKPPMTNLDAGLTDDPTRRRATVANQVTAFLRARPMLLNPGPPADPVQAGKAWPSPRSCTNVIEALSQLRPEDEEAQTLFVTGGVGEGAAVGFFAWMATANLIDPRAAMRDPSIVDWSARVDVLFALAHGVAAVALAADSRRAWDAAVDVLVAMSDHARLDVALDAVHVLFSQTTHLSQGLRAEHRHAFGDLLARMGVLTPATTTTQGAARPPRPPGPRTQSPTPRLASSSTTSAATGAATAPTSSRATDPPGPRPTCPGARTTTRRTWRPEPSAPTRSSSTCASA